MDKGDPGSMLGLAVSLPLIASLCVGARFWARFENKAGLKWDDWLILPALVFTIGMSIALIVGVALGVTAYPRPSSPRQDKLTENPPQKIREQKIGFVKCSLLSFYHRVFCVKASNYRLVIRISIVFCALWSFGFFLSSFLDFGLPLSNNWGPLTIYKTKCHGLGWEQGFAVSDFLLDLGILILPLTPISLKRKLGVTIIVMIGTMAIVASLIRLILVFTIVDQVKSAFLTDDGNILDSEVLWWMLLEAGLSVVAASLPAIHSFPLRK